MNCYIYLVHDSVVNVPYYVLDDFELLKEFSSGLENILRENIFLSIDPQIWESFLSRVQNLSQVAQRSLFIQYLVSFTELLSVFPGGTKSLESFTKSFDLI